jgi:hypothetical protein
MTEFNYEEDTAIDPDQILEEWLAMPSTYFNYRKALTDIQKEVKQVWEVKKTTRALLIKEAKEQGAKNDADREAYFRPHPEYQKVTQDLIDIEHRRDLVEDAVSSLLRKEKSLEGASSIMLKMEYWGLAAKEDLEIHPGKRIVDILKTEKVNARRSRKARK